MPPPTDFSLDIPIFSKIYDFYKNLSQVIVSFPKTKRYTLGQKIDNVTLDLIELLFSIPQANDKLKTLNRISVKLDLLKVLIRLAKDTQAMKNKNYLGLQSNLHEVGKMLAGWIRTTKQNLPQ